MERTITLFLSSVGMILLFFSAIQISESVLWDLIIDFSIEKNPLSIDEKPIVSGTIVDHAGKPVPNAEVQIRLEKVSGITFTNSTGEFSYELDKVSIPGYYFVNVKATSEDNKIGLAKMELHVRGPVMVSSQSSYELEVMDSNFSEKINQEKVENDPLALTLYNYYIFEKIRKILCV